MNLKIIVLSLTAGILLVIGFLFGTNKLKNLGTELMRGLPVLAALLFFLNFPIWIFNLFDEPSLFVVGTIVGIIIYFFAVLLLCSLSWIGWRK